MSQSFYARTSDHGFETCVEHLSMVAALSGAFADTFGQLNEGLIAGLYHDEGKYSDAFQQRIRDPEHTAKCDHSSAGALQAWQQMHNIAALAIAAHHAGLTDMGTPGDIDDATWFARLRRITADNTIDAINVANDRMTNQFGHTVPVGKPSPGEPYDIMMRTRMILSCLVDADRLDAEYFVENGCERSERRWLDYAHQALGGNNMAQEHAPNITTITACAQRLTDMMHQHHSDAIASLTSIINGQNARYLNATPSSSINAARSDILRQCRDYGQNPQHSRDIYTLTAPTGSGKTNASITFALNHAKTHGFDRIIYVIPYMSIIDQTANTFARIFGDDNVLAHYSQADWQTSNDDTSASKQIMAENWNAPIVVTTAVQFFESLYSNKTSPLRKLHNIANSVIVFDEAQTLPVEYLLPCLKAICSLVDDYRCSAVLCTATQPAVGKYINDIRNKSHTIKEIVNISNAQRRLFDRTVIEFTDTITQHDLANRLAGQSQTLCVVNTRIAAQELYEQVKRQCTDTNSVYCLTTLQCPYDRQTIIDEIRTKLANDQPCRVISTSLIEAGVDLDFPTAWRQTAGLDSILQIAGRCNRNGKRNKDDSVVTIFDDGERIPRYIKQNTDAMALTRSIYDDVASADAIHTYFNALFGLKGDSTLDKHDILKQSASTTMPFAHIANDVNIVNNNSVDIIINRNDTADKLIDQLRNRCANRTTMRQLSIYTISIPKHQFDKIKAYIDIVEIGKTGHTVAILNDPNMYAPRQGLMMNNNWSNPEILAMF